MAPKARKSNKARRSAGGAKKSVSIEMVKQAVAALGDRNGSSINAIFNYLVRTKKVSANSRTLVILAIGRACREGSMEKKSPKAFVLRSGGKRKASSPKRRKRKAKRARKSKAKKSAGKRRRRQRKRRTLKKKAKRSTKRRSRKTSRKSTKKTRKARRSQKPKAFNRPAAKPMRRRPVRKAAKRINYRE